MPQPKVLLDYERCDPESCEYGICAAAKVCEKKVLRQEAPGEMPDISPSFAWAASIVLQLALEMRFA